MRSQETSVGKMLTKIAKGNLISRIIKLFMFIILFSSSFIKAQDYVADFPATDLGQTLLITSSDPLYDGAMEASSVTRGEAQNYVDGCPNSCQPQNYISCTPEVCCQTTAEWNYVLQRYEYRTVCWSRATMKFLAEFN